MLGRSLGNYQLVSKIGEGGMGAVYLAQHKTLRRRAAVKILREELSSNTEIVARFHNEARIATAVHHPGIIEVYDVGMLDDRHAYIVMEFLDGESLGSRIANGRCTVSMTLAILRAIARALQAAHELGIVHRDLKPENVFLVPDAELPSGERVKLLDFGIAKLSPLIGETRQTHTGVVMGTPTYMAPEQCRGAGSVDHRADLYSLGCIAYEMLCDAPPFLAEGAGEVIARHLYFEPTPPCVHRPELQPEIEALVLQLLRKDPRARPGSAFEVACIIDRLVASIPTIIDERRDASVVTLLPTAPEPPLPPSDLMLQTISLRPISGSAMPPARSLPRSESPERSLPRSEPAVARTLAPPARNETVLSGAVADEDDPELAPPPRTGRLHYYVAGIAATAVVLAVAILGVRIAHHDEPPLTASNAGQGIQFAPPPEPKPVEHAPDTRPDGITTAGLVETAPPSSPLAAAAVPAILPASGLPASPSTDPEASPDPGSMMPQPPVRSVHHARSHRAKSSKVADSGAAAGAPTTSTPAVPVPATPASVPAAAANRSLGVKLWNVSDVGGVNHVWISVSNSGPEEVLEATVRLESKFRKLDDVKFRFKRIDHGQTVQASKEVRITGTSEDDLTPSVTVIVTVSNVPQVIVTDRLTLKTADQLP
ncbi:MAG TPA: protein kinase [Kofleriaceae bacterium]|jgi:serine/threonine protein kinase|nr:protein kinase [Kofleriaceae bacterium]